MSGKSERAADYVGHMLQAAEEIGTFIADLDHDAFLASRMATAAVIRNLEIMGEASRRVMEHCPDVADRHPAVPWREVDRVRNRVAHGDDTVDPETVWTIARRDVPALADELRAVLIALRSRQP